MAPTVMITVRVEPEILARINAEARRRGLSRSAWIRAAASGQNVTPLLSEADSKAIQAAPPGAIVAVQGTDA
jgi:hypothetical protein